MGKQQRMAGAAPGKAAHGLISAHPCGTSVDRYHTRNSISQKDRRMTAPRPETIIVSQWKIACDGDGPVSGHPRVWLTIPEDKGFVECGYCDRRYVHQSAAETLK